MEKKVIEKKNWVSSFNLIGKPKISEEYTFKIDQRSEQSKWVYNSMNLGIDCGEKYGVIYCEGMGGYGEENKNVIYAHGKNDDGTDDFSKQIVVDWDDRFNEDVLEKIGDMSFITIGLRKTDKGKTHYEKFLSMYDAIAYVKEYLREDMVVNVRGTLKYSVYNDVVQVRKNITNIALSNAEDASKYKASFSQSILIDKDSANLKNIDKDKGVMYVDAKVLDFLKEYNGIKLVNAKGEEKGGQFPYDKQFEFEFPDLSNEKQCKLICDKLFKVKKDITQINFEGEFIEGGASVTATWDDVPNDIKELVAMGLYTEEQALARCSSNGNRESRMVLNNPVIRMVGEDKDNKVPVIQVFEEQYKEEDLILDYLFANNKSDEDIEPPFEADSVASGDDSMDWINQL